MKTVRLTVDVVIHDDGKLEDYVRNDLMASSEPVEVDDILDGYGERVAGMVAEALVNSGPAAPLDYGIEIETLKAEVVQ